MQLSELLRHHGARGERPRPDYPVAALCGAGLWELLGHDGDVPSAHGDAGLLRWFTATQPRGGLVESADRLLRGSAEARAAVTAVIVDHYLADIDPGGLLADVGLASEEVAGDLAAEARERLDGDPREQYRWLCAGASRGEEGRAGRRDLRVTAHPVRSAIARRAVLVRSQGRCENPGCPGQPADVTDADEPILEVDHVRDIARGGADHPRQMIALCPNCHAVKTRGRTREQLRQDLLATAEKRHAAWQ